MRCRARAADLGVVVGGTLIDAASIHPDRQAALPPERLVFSAAARDRELTAHVDAFPRLIPPARFLAPRAVARAVRIDLTSRHHRALEIVTLGWDAQVRARTAPAGRRRRVPAESYDRHEWGGRGSARAT
jgi:hypothetical protein